MGENIQNQMCHFLGPLSVTWHKALNTVIFVFECQPAVNIALTITVISYRTRGLTNFRNLLGS